MTKGIDKWYEEKSKNTESFERDEQYIEHEQSPTHFASSSDEEDETISLDSLNKKHIASKG